MQLDNRKLFEQNQMMRRVLLTYVKTLEEQVLALGWSSIEAYHEHCKPDEAYPMAKAILDGKEAEDEYGELCHYVAQTAARCNVPYECDFTPQETLDRIAEFYLDKGER